MSTTQSAHSTQVADAYDRLAPTYDLLTAGYQHDKWLERIEQVARLEGLKGRRLLDLACGTGKSFLPLLHRGYRVTACDISEGMVGQAQSKSADAEVFVADIRMLERVGEFDLITCLNDAVNYLLEPEDLTGFFCGARRNLDPEGLLIFDVNTLRGYSDGFACQAVLDNPDAFIAWSGRCSDTDPTRFDATVTVFAPSEGLWNRKAGLHQQRYWSENELAKVARRAGLRVTAIYGQRRGALLDPIMDEEAHTKALYLLTHDSGKGVA